MITADEQEQLGGLRIGIVGLSVGHVIAHTLAAEGLCGQLKLADFDELELSNLNRVPATLLDLGENKATVAAQRIAEIDPYLDVEIFTDGLTEQNIDSFLDGLDLLVEECDSLDIKAVLRRAARSRRLPVLMATSDRGLVDVERFDLDPDRPILHGLLGDVNPSDLSGLSSRDKIPHVLRVLEIGKASTRGAASMVEVDRTLSTWPQLAGDVILGASAVAEAVRRVGIGEALPSGRVRIDVAAAMDELSDPLRACAPATVDVRTEFRPPSHLTPIELIADAARLAPSAGNAQPWRITKSDDAVAIEIDQDFSSTLDVKFRGSAVALGAAVYNARVAAAANGLTCRIEYLPNTDTTPLRAVIHLAAGDDPALAELFGHMIDRRTNRRKGHASALSADKIELLERAADREGATLHLLSDRGQIDEAAGIIGATDRIRFLTPRLHEEMIGELRWPGDPEPNRGLDIASLEFDSAAIASLDVLRRSDVMRRLADWQGGSSLGDNTRDNIRASSAVGILTVRDHSLIGYARGGSAADAVWIEAQRHGLGVHPVSPLFLYALDQSELQQLSPEFESELAGYRDRIRDLADMASGQSFVMVFRIVDTQPPFHRSRRLGLTHDLREVAQ